ncbi:MAG: DUF2142 domain-containing protein [Acidimicrobiales bacterium]
MEPQQTGPPGERLLWWGTFAVCAALGLVWAFSTPIMASPDESAHTLKAVAVADGQWTMSTTSRTEPDGRISPITRIDVPHGFVDLGFTTTCFNGQAGVAANCATPDGSATDRITWETYVAAYPPTYYLLVGWPSRFLDPEVAVYAMRACSVLVAAALLASGLASARAIRRVPSESGHRRVAGVAVAGAALAVTPITLFLVGSVNPNGFEIAAGFCVWLSALDLLGRRDRPPTRLIVRFVLSAALLGGARPLSPAMLVCILATVLVLTMDRPTWRRLAGDRRVRWAAGALGVAFVASSSLVLLAHSTSAVIRSPLPPDLTRGTIIRRSVEMWRFRAEQLIGVLGNLDTKLPSTLVVGWFAAVLALVVLALVRSSWRRRVVLVGLVGACLLMPTVSESVSGATYGLGWQGRYTLPVAVGVPIVAGWLIDRWGPRSSALATTLVVVGVVGAAVGQAWALLTMLDRYSVGLPTSPFGLRHAVDWHGPLQPITLFGLGVVAGTAWAAWLLVLALRPVPAPVSGSS